MLRDLNCKINGSFCISSTIAPFSRLFRIVTIGPAVMLCLLGVTFFAGSCRQRCANQERVRRRHTRRVGPVSSSPKSIHRRPSHFPLMLSQRSSYHKRQRQGEGTGEEMKVPANALTSSGWNEASGSSRLPCAMSHQRTGLSQPAPGQRHHIMHSEQVCECVGGTSAGWFCSGHNIRVLLRR